MSDFNTKLDEILIAYKKVGDIRTFPLGKAKQAIIDLIDKEIIGEDIDPVYGSAGSITRKNIIEYQNSLKADQRNILRGGK